MSHPPPIAGELVVIALKAEKLQHQAPAKQDPFCIFRIGDVVKRTKTDRGGGQYPIWDDQVNIPVGVGYHQMHVQIFNRDTNPSNLMADGIVDLSKVLRETEHDGYFPLLFRGRPGGGDLYLELTFYQSKKIAIRPQQQIRYQYPPGGNPGYHPNQPPPPPQNRPLPPIQHHRPPPMQHQQEHRPPPMQHQQPPLQHRPPPMQQQQGQHRPPPPPMQHMPSTPMQHRPPPLQHMPHQPQHSPFPQPQPRPSSSMGTSHFSPVMPSPQPLLSAPYNPAPSPASRPANLNYPSDQRQSYPYSPQGPPPGGFHDPNRPPPPMGYPPMRPMPPQGGYNQRPPPPHGGYPPY